jgi:hypothetical protein
VLVLEESEWSPKQAEVDPNAPLKMLIAHSLPAFAKFRNAEAVHFDCKMATHGLFRGSFGIYPDRHSYLV